MCSHPAKITIEDVGGYLLVHGATCGGWVWDDVATTLRALGHEVAVVDQLPSGGTDPAKLGTLADDAAHVRGLLEDIADPAVLVGHSYGGMVITELADHPKVRHSLYLTAMWPERGQSLSGLLGGGLPKALQWGPDDTIKVSDDVDAAWQGFAPDMERSDAQRMLTRLGLQSGSSYRSPSTAPERTHPTTYVIAELESAAGVAGQEAWAAKADYVIRIPAAHMAMVSRPSAVADALLVVG